MRSHANSGGGGGGGGLLSTIFGRGGAAARGDGEKKRRSELEEGEAPRRKSTSDKRASKFEAAKRSAQQRLQEIDNDDDHEEKATTALDARVQNSLSNSSGSGSGGACGGSSSGYASQLSAAVQAASQQSRGAAMPRVLLNGDRNNNHLADRQPRGQKARSWMATSAAHEQVYHSLASSAHLARQPMVPMMIDDEDEGESGGGHDDGDDDDELADEEQTLDFAMSGEDLAKSRKSNQHQQSLRLIDGLRQQHEMRYGSAGDQRYLARQPDDKLSLANSIMFYDDGAAAAPHSHRHFSLPPTDTTPTTSRGTTLLACGGDHGDQLDSDASISSAHLDLATHVHRHQQRLAYEAAGLRGHLRDASAEKSNFNTTNHHDHHKHHHNHHYACDQHNAAIYYQPNLVADRGHQSHLLSSSDQRTARSSSFLQFQVPSSKFKSQDHLPTSAAQGKPKTLIYHQDSRLAAPNNGPQYHHKHLEHHALASQQNLRISSTNNNNNNNNKHAGTFRLASSVNARPMTNRMRSPRADASSQYLTAPESSDSSHARHSQQTQRQQQQQVRRSKSNQQLSVSPTRHARSGVAKSSSAHAPSMPSADGPALVAASQIDANLAAISSAGGGGGYGRRGVPLNGHAPVALGCCGKLAKFLLFIANILFWCAGIALGAWGILALVEDHKNNLSQLLVFDSGTRMSLFQLLAWSFITLGCATVLVGVCGCSAMFKNSRWILGLYIFLILAIFALDLATGLLAMIFQERLVANVRLRLVSKLRNEYGLQASFTAAIDYIQTRYECCGLDGHFDYDQSLWRLQRLGGFEATVARTCCHLRNTLDDQAHVNPRPVNESMCQSTDVRFHQSYRYRRGCLDDLERLIRHKIWTFTIGCGIVGGIILLSLALATCFCRSIPSDASSGKSGKKSSSASGASVSRHANSKRVHQQALAYVENVSKKQGYHSAPHYR